MRPWRYSGVEPMSKTLPMNISRNDRAYGVSRQRQGRLIRILLRTSLVLFLLAFFATTGIVLWLRAGEKAALPPLDGEIHLAGLSAPVNVIRDAHGVPHIQAATLEDMLVAQGYVRRKIVCGKWTRTAAMPTEILPRSWAHRWLGTTKRSACCSSEHRPAHLRESVCARPRSVGRLCARSQPLYCAERRRKKTTGRVQAAWLSTGAVDRRGFNQRGHDDGADARHALASPSSRERVSRQSSTIPSFLRTFIRLGRGAIVRPPA